MKKTIYHAGKEEGEYRVLELEKNEKGEIYLRIKHGKKGEKENVEMMTTRLGYDEFAGFLARIERLLIHGGTGKATIFHEKDEGKYKVSEVEITEKGEIFFRMSEGTKGEKENRVQMSIRLSEDELTGLWFRGRAMLLS